MSVPSFEYFMIPILEFAKDGKDISSKLLYISLEDVLIKKYNIQSSDNIIMNNGLTKVKHRVG